MLSCRDVTERASAQVDGESTLPERLALGLHLMMCAPCRRFMRQWRCLVAALGRRSASPTPAVDEAFIARVLARLQ